MAEAKPSDEEWAALVAQLREENAQLRARLAELEEQLQAAHRQAAPFRRRDALKKPAGEKKKPGRPAGHPGVHREIPAEIDAEIDEPLACCPHCAGSVTAVTERVQYIEECPAIQPVRTKLTTYTGFCAVRRSGKPAPAADFDGDRRGGGSVGAAGAALAVSLVHQSGLSLKKACDTLWHTCGLKLSAGGLAQLLQRAAGRCAGWYDEIVTSIRHSPAVNADETSWYVGRPGWWLWVFTTPTATAYVVDESRGAEVVDQVLGDAFGGMLVTDCLASYNAIACAKHKCIAHHLRVLKEHEQSLERRGCSSQYLFLWKVLWKEVIETWRRREELGAAKFLETVERITRGVDRLLGLSPPEPEEVRFRDRLLRQREHLLGCLTEPAAEPTNNRAERDLRPAVINRKISCGNRTVAGKTAWQVLRSVAVTIQHRGQNFLDLMASRLSLPPAGR